MSEFSIQGIARNENPYDYTVFTADAVPLYMDKHPEEIAPWILYTAEEIEEINDIRTSIETYRSESVVRFITGDKPFSEWNNYTNELEKIGLSKYLEVAQQAYDRMKSGK